MLNPYPCVVWPLALLGAFGAFWMWRKRRERKGAWIMPVVFFAGVLLVLWSVVWLEFGRFWLDRLFAIYIPQ
ncbi:MAG: hypothetical protein AB1846_16475 [Chloroflexota bacterium]